ncbi:SWIM zinc finger family protein [Pseudovibrio sp. Alg231-02]|uniref:SWIM zinc finger family protein n=1 Tax=Pseudovibrio sp. Alg231-02 TaxID=1922223 RepID=UPI000D560330|nr:SWIM zinc finger family protein [Pseudovibrio sp. Alg231-02]
MSTFHETLLAQDDKALVAIASPGLLRRAKAGLTKPDTIENVEVTAESAVLQIESYQVELDKGGPAKAQCGCSATGVCKHILMAVLHLRGTIEPETSADKISAYSEISKLSLDEIERFAGGDWPQALRIAALSKGAVPTSNDNSCVVRLQAASGPVTFLAGGGLRAAMFKGTEGRRKRTVAAAALVLCKHDLPDVEEVQAQVDPKLLENAGAAVCSALQHGLKGNPLLAQDRLNDLAISARADAVPRLAAMLRGAAMHAGQLATHAPNADPVVYLTELSACYALIRALVIAPDDPLLTGQLRRDYQPAEPFELAILGVSKWRTPAGARGLTIYGWDGERFLSSGPARAAGSDITFSIDKAFEQSWWQGLAPSQMPGKVLHFREPRISEDGILPRQLQVAPDPNPLRLESLPFFADWQRMRADLVRRMGIGLRMMYRPEPSLIWFASATAPYFDEINQCYKVDVHDAEGHELKLNVPDKQVGQLLCNWQHNIQGALIEGVPEGEGVFFRLISLYAKAPFEIWNVTAEGPPEAWTKITNWQKFRGQVHKVMRSTQRPLFSNQLSAFSFETLQALCDGFSAPEDAKKFAELVQKAEELGLTNLARTLSQVELQDRQAVLKLCWKVVLIRRAALLNDSLIGK